MSTPSDLSGQPPADTPVPDGLKRVLAGSGLGEATLIPTWLNGIGGLTFAVVSSRDAKSPDFYAKWNPAGAGESLSVEAERMRWLGSRHPTPQVVGLHVEKDGEVLVTKALAGESAVSPRWLSKPEIALRALGEGLRRLHDLVATDCPYDWGVSYRMNVASVASGAIEPPPSIDKLVICQGDPCAPNTVLSPDGGFLGHLDLACLGVADRWADLAVMSMSLEWNYRDFDESLFWEAYGIAPDPVRIDYYRRLWEIT